MEAVFLFKVTVSDDNVTTTMGMEKMEDMECEKVTALTKLFTDVNNRVKKVICPQPAKPAAAPEPEQNTETAQDPVEQDPENNPQEE